MRRNSKPGSPSHKRASATHNGRISRQQSAARATSLLRNLLRNQRERENSIRAYGVNPWAPNLLVNLHADLMYLGNERIALLVRLRAIWQQWEVTRSSAIGSDISNGQRPRLGTTVGDFNSDILNLPELDEDPAKLKDELQTRFDQLTGGSGLRVTTGEAGGIEVDSIPEDKALQSETKSLWERVEYEQKISQLLDGIEVLLDYLTALKEKNDATRQRINDKWLKLIGAKTPNPEATDGTYAPKHPIYTPYDQWLGRPRSTKPLDDPRVDGEQFGPSGVMRGRDQAVDPNPDDNDFGLGDRKMIVSTSGGVTDPQRRSL